MQVSSPRVFGSSIRIVQTQCSEKRYFVWCETYLNMYRRRQSVILIYMLRQDNFCLQRPKLKESFSGARTDKQR